MSAIDPGCALVVIDIQKGIVAMPSAHPIDGVIANVVRLVDALTPRAQGAPPARDLPPTSRTTSPRCARTPRTTSASQAPVGAFYGTELELQLRRRGITDIVLCGVSTSDAMTDGAAAAHDRALDTIFPRIGEIGTTDEILRRSDRPSRVCAVDARPSAKRVTMSETPGRLAGKVALITGGASGIGLATARRFVEQGARVTIADIDLATAKTVAAGNEALDATALNVTDDARWAVVVDDVVARFGKLDVVVNNAGVVSIFDIETCSNDEWHRTMSINVDGTFFGCRHAVRAMKAHGGSIVNLSSVSGLIGGRNLVAYNASKGAVRLLTKSVALHCAGRGYGIRCNSVHPTFVETAMSASMIDASRDPERMRATLTAMVPLGRFARPEEIADMIVYLASDESQFVTGAEFVIDGGLTAT